jgi:hypothetical protein
MDTPILVLQTVLFGYSLWLGLYLIARDPRLLLLQVAGAGALCYALMLALDLLEQTGDPPAGLQTFNWLLPAPLNLCWGLAARQALRRPAPARSAFWLATLFVVLGSASLLLNWTVIPRAWLLIALSLDFTVFGVLIALLDARGNGEILWPHFVRSFDAAALAGLVFGGQVGLVMALSAGATPAMLTLLLTTVAAAVAWQVFLDPLQQALDRVAFANAPRLVETRAELRSAAGELPRLPQTPDLAVLSEEEFARLTRRALSSLGNLPKLAANPLIALPQVAQRSGQSASALERAAELRALLIESIEHLKPRTGDSFGKTDDWRYYNALYFPYVVGVKPYSRRLAGDDHLPSHAQAALDWFQAQVPERTLHNWQNAAARVIARHLRETTLL